MHIFVEEVAQAEIHDEEHEEGGHEIDLLLTGGHGPILARGSEAIPSVLAACIDTSHLSRIENNRTQIALNALERIADALDLPIAELFKGIPPRKRAEPELDRAVSAVRSRDAPPRKRGMILRVVKTIVKDG